MTALWLALAVAQAAEPLPWRLAGVYDLAAVSALDGVEATRPGWAWQPAAGMLSSCGPAKAPDGIGAFEAEALGNGLSTALVVLLSRTGHGDGVPGPEDLRVGLGRDEPQVLLQPAVEPRYLAVSIQGEAEPRHRQLVRTQLEMELCMEHKVGRSWVGGDATSLRQAFLLDPPDGGRPDRKAFGGQRDPVPALLGPPDACLVDDAGERLATAGRGEGSLDLVPSDVWGASLRPCGEDERPGAPLAGGDPRVPLWMDDGAPPRALPRWSSLIVHVGSADAQGGVLVDLSMDGEPLLQGADLFPRGDQTDPGGLIDLLANVPRRYPVLGPPEDPQRTVALIVPAWQVEEALRRLEAGDPQHPQARAATRATSAVADVLEHPELLFVQVRSPGSDGDRWLNLTEGMGRSGLDPRAWGYTVGLLASREPVLEAGPTGPTWQSALIAHRALEQSAFLAGAAAVLLLGLAGLRRLSDLWTPVPLERADYWPGQGGEPPTPGGDAPSSPNAALPEAK